MGVKFSQLPVASSVAADDYIAVLDSSESVLKRTPISHASSGSEYGLGTTTAYGHTKIVDNLSQSSLTSGEALSSRQGNVIANDMGVVELSTTAAHTHAVGDFFMLIGQFVKCTAAISVGDTINIGTNVVATNIGEVLSQLNSNVASQSTLIGNTAIPSSLGTTVTGAITNLNSSRFPDWSNEIASGDIGSSSTRIYEATQDCYMVASIYGWNNGSASGTVDVNGVVVSTIYYLLSGSQYAAIRSLIPLKKGDKVTAKSGYAPGSYKVYGLR